MVRIGTGWPAAGVTILVLLGCSSQAEPVPLEELEARFGAAECALLFGCCSPGDRAARLPDTVTTEEECIALVPSLGYEIEEGIRFGLSTGRYRYDAAAAGACIAAIRSCQASHCQFLVGIVADGAACSTGGECVSRHCDEGICAPPRALGEPCTFDGCDAGLACVDGLCRQPRPDGEPCVTFHGCISGTCDISGVCAPRDVCS